MLTVFVELMNVLCTKPVSTLVGRKKKHETKDRSLGLVCYVVENVCLDRSSACLRCLHSRKRMIESMSKRIL